MTPGRMRDPRKPLRVSLADWGQVLAEVACDGIAR
jgi:hypothetical protein